MDSPHRRLRGKYQTCRGGGGQLPATQPRSGPDVRHVDVYLLCRDDLLCRARCPQGKDALCCINMKSIMKVFFPTLTLILIHLHRAP